MHSQSRFCSCEFIYLQNRICDQMSNLHILWLSADMFRVVRVDYSETHAPILNKAMFFFVLLSVLDNVHLWYI